MATLIQTLQNILVGKDPLLAMETRRILKPLVTRKPLRKFSRARAGYYEDAWLDTFHETFQRLALEYLEDRSRSSAFDFS